MYVDPFRDGFTLTQLSQAITTLPNMYSRITQMGLFAWRPQSTNTISIEMRNGVLALVPMTPWGGVAPKNKSGRRNMKSFTIPHSPLEDTVMASDVMGVREFGTENQLAAVTTRVNDKLQEMKNKFDITHEWQFFNCIKGYVLDPADGSIVENYFDAFGITKKVVNFELDDPTTNVRNKCVEVLRYIEDNANGELINKVIAPVSPEFFDALITHASVKEVYLGWSEAANKLGMDLRKGFTFGGLTFEEYRAKVGNNRFIDEGEGHAFPLGTTSTFSDFGAPADFNETVNTLAIPYYARQKNKDFNRGIDLHVQSNRLPLVSNPGLLVELHAE